MLDQETRRKLQAASSRQIASALMKVLADGPSKRNLLILSYGVAVMLKRIEDAERDLPRENRPVTSDSGNGGNRSNGGGNRKGQ